MAGGDPKSYCPELWLRLLFECNVKTMLDVGCGTGEAVKWWLDHGVNSWGIDGLKRNVRLLNGLGTVHDLSHRAYKHSRKPDLVWCSEVVEHVAPQHLDKLLSTICQGKYLVMTHCLPGVGGYHHVNCQESGYWIDKITEFGYHYNEALTLELRDVFPEYEYWSRSGLVFSDFVDTDFVETEDVEESIPTVPIDAVADDFEYDGCSDTYGDRGLDGGECSAA